MKEQKWNYDYTEVITVESSDHSLYPRGEQMEEN